MIMKKKYKFEVDLSDIRLDLFLVKKLADFSRSTIQHSIKSNLVKVNSELAKASTRVHLGDFVDCSIEEKVVNDSVAPQNIPLNIIFEDSEILVIDKPAGLVVHPGNGNKDGTIANALAYYCNELSSVEGLRPGIIHRLDKNTSGVMIIAKNNHSHINISNQFLDRKVKKTYYALAWGRMKKEGVIKGFITRDNFNRTKFKMSNTIGKSSKTKYYLESYFGPISLIKLIPETGRTHQLRVHLNSIGHPIFSDQDYSGGKKRIKSYHVKYTNILKKLFKCIDRVALHAGEIEFLHPKSNDRISFTSPFPDDFKNALGLLKNE